MRSDDSPALVADPLVYLESVLETAARYTELGPELNPLVRAEAHIEVGARQLPIYSLTIGCGDPKAPAVGFFGGVHGLERIGATVVISYLHSLLRRLKWDELLWRKLEGLRLVFMPIVNPGGLLLGTRANPAGVDLMRNAPIDATAKVPFLVGGQRTSPFLPWYRGRQEDPMEPEAIALCAVVLRELRPHGFSIALDCHSGFGIRDRIWFPFACSAEPPESLPDIRALAELYAESHPNHRYVFEPQCRQYHAHGDLWDYLCLQQAADPNARFIPLTLEMGSWLWVKKNPRQLFSRHGLFNPLIEHRLQRVLRRHQSWMEFLTQAAFNYRRWLPSGAARQRCHRAALRDWYGDGRS